MSELRKIIAMIPTYNEAENIGPLMEQVLDQDPRLEVLVVDDDSPDGTWRLVQGAADRDPRVHLLHRTRDRGRGLAGVAGFRRALDLGADAVIEMDGDFSHHPRELPALIEALDSCDLAIGSRAVPGGEDLRPSALRRQLTRLSSSYIRRVLGVSVQDPTSGYRAFSAGLLRRVDLDRLRAATPATLEEVLMACKALGARIREVPIRFEPRHEGTSKLGPATLARVFVTIPLIRLRGALRSR